MTSTTEIGNEFEDKLYAVLEQEIAAGRFLFRPQDCLICRKPNYYSKDREKDISFDISIEATLPGQTEYSLLILIECKNYGAPIPVDDAEEFFAKIDQIGAAKIKGIIASTNSFQRGTIQYCQSKGIGLLRYFADETLKWQLPRSPSALVNTSYAIAESSEAAQGVTTEDHKPKYFDIYAYSAYRYTVSLNQFILNLINDRTDDDAVDFSDIVNPRGEHSQYVPYQSEANIENRAQEILTNVNYSSGPVDLDSICNFFAETMGLDVSFSDSTNRSILGRIRFNPLEIVVYPANHPSIYRQRFTMAHELGHLAMSHADYMYGEYCESPDTNPDQPNELGIKDLMRMEWQANAFASCLLLPQRPFLSDFLRIAKELDIHDRGFGLIYLDSQPVNANTFRTVASRLRAQYHVSRAAIKIRLKKLGYLTEPKGL